MKRKPYPSDLSDGQWALLEPLLLRITQRRRPGRPREIDLREVLNALFYHAREGCTWRALPHDLPPWKTVYNYFRWWDWDGTWQKVLDTLRPLARVQAGRAPLSSAAAIDSQSVKTALGGKERGTDGGKKVKGRKRHILVDSLGFLIAVVVTAANVDAARAAQDLFAEVRGRDFPLLRVVFADHKYHNYGLYDWLSRHRQPYRLEIVSRPKGETDPVQALAAAMGSRADVCVGGALLELEQGLRAHARVECSYGPDCGRPSYAPKTAA